MWDGLIQLNSEIRAAGEACRTWEQRRGKLHFCPGFSLGCGRGIHFQGGGGSTKCIVVPLVTSHLFLIKEAAEPNLSALAFLRSAGGSGTDGDPWPGPEHPLGQQGPAGKAAREHSMEAALEYLSFGKVLPSGQNWLFSPNVSHPRVRSWD